MGRNNGKYAFFFKIPYYKYSKMYPPNSPETLEWGFGVCFVCDFKGRLLL